MAADAITHPDGPLLVLGGAGTGKTEFLQRRFAWLVEQGCPAHSLLALAFSARAASDMRAAIEERVEPPYEELHVHTFRSFCERLLRDEAPEAGLAPDFAAVSRADRVALLLESIDELSLRRHEIRGNPAPLLAGFVSRIDRLKAEMTGARAGGRGTPRRCRRSRMPSAACGRASWSSPGSTPTTTRLLGERGALDAGDLVLRTFRLLHERPHVRERAAERFRHVLVDDLQEATFAQTTLLALLCSEHERVDGGRASAGSRSSGATFPRRSRAGAAEREQALPGRGAGRGGERPGRAAAPEAPRGRLGAAVALRVRARAGAGRGGGVRAAGRGRHRAGHDRGAGALAGRRRPGGRLGAGGARACPSGSRARLPTSSARRCATCWRGCGCWPTRPTRARRCGRCRGRRSALHSVDIARLTQLARRRKLDMPSAVGVALEGPQLTPEGRDRAQAFLRLYRAAPPPRSRTAAPTASCSA